MWRHSAIIGFCSPSFRASATVLLRSVYPRLLGLQRMLWARSRVGLREAQPTLTRLAKNVDLMLIKGAARLAEDAANFRGRAAYDIDIVVRPEESVRTLDILAADGWAANKGVSTQYLREHLLSIRSINMLKGEFGDIDLHVCPFLPGQGDASDDAALWKRSVPATLIDIPVRIPARRGPARARHRAWRIGGAQAQRLARRQRRAHCDGADFMVAL